MTTDEQLRAEQAQLMSTWVSTMESAPLPYESVGLIFGQPGSSMDEALVNLQRRAIETGSSAVLGAAFVPYVHGNGAHTTTQFVGYGTAVRWRIAPQDVPPAPSAADLGWTDPTMPRR